MKIILSGGGTGGHIYPAMALIKTLRKKNSDTEILYIGKANAQEQKLCEKEKVPFKGIQVRYFYRKLLYKNILTLCDFIRAYRKVKKIIREFKPDVVIGTGGYVCSPVVLAASRMKIRTIIHEQNSVPGMTNKLLGKYADKVAVSFISAEKYFPKGKVVLTGNPRAEEVAETKYLPKSNFGLSEDKKLVLFFTGSLGAKYVNEAIVKILPALSQRTDIEVIFVTGPSHFNNINSEMKRINIGNNIFLKPYVDNMPELLKVCDLVICRAGATSLAEITSLGIPAVLIPSPYVTNNHQEKNAQDLVNKNAAVMIRENELGEKLLPEINKLLNDKVKLQEMKINSKKMGIQDAGDKFISLIQKIM